MVINFHMQEKRLTEAKEQIEKLERDLNRLKANQVKLSFLIVILRKGTRCHSEMLPSS